MTAKGIVREAFRRIGYRVEGTRYTPRHLFEPDLVRLLEFDDVVCRRLFETPAPWTFVQIGAFDGVANDPLRRFIARGGWRGVMLEPQPSLVHQLRDLYRGDDQIVVVAAALDGERGQRSLYTVDAEGLPAWTGQIASFDRAHVEKHQHLVPDIAARIRELTVECITFDDVLDKLPPHRLDLLQIDAEGADGYLISLFPFQRLRPAIVHWEAKNMTKSQQEATLDQLCGLGYRICRSGAEDMLAIDAAEPSQRPH